MGTKPDTIKAMLLIFAVGLVITGFTTIHASEDNTRAQDTMGVGAVQVASDRLNR